MPESAVHNLDTQVHDSGFEVVISQTAEYALRAAVWLAAHPDQVQTTEQIAQATHVPSGYLAKVLQMLVRGRLVGSQPGPGGGFRLTVPSHQLSVLSVVNAVEPFERIVECPLQIPSHDGRLCKLHYRLDAARALVEDAFRACTLAELLDATDAGANPLCARPQP